MVAPSVLSYDLNLPPAKERHKMEEIRAVRCVSEEIIIILISEWKAEGNMLSQQEVIMLLGGEGRITSAQGNKKLARTQLEWGRAK